MASEISSNEPPKTGESDDRTTSVALVEDSVSLRRNLERMLGRAKGVQCVCSCGSAEQAWKEIPPVKPDVILMDIHLPGASGIECTARLKALLPSVQVIMLTVYEDTASIFSALKAGACGYLLKRSSPAEILEALTTIQTGGAPMTSEIARKIVVMFQTPAAGSNDAGTLSARELSILELLSQGQVSKEIADTLSISYHTVRVHTKHIYEKLHVRSRSEAVLRFMAEKSPALPNAPFN